MAILSALYVINQVPSSALDFQTPLDTLACLISIPVVLKLLLVCLDASFMLMFPLIKKVS